MDTFKYTQITRFGTIRYGDIPKGKTVRQVPQLPRVGTVVRTKTGWCAEGRIGAFYAPTRAEAVSKFIAAINEDN